MASYRSHATLWGAALMILSMIPAPSHSQSRSTPSVPSPIDLGAAEPQRGVISRNVQEDARLAARAAEGERIVEDTEWMEEERMQAAMRGGPDVTQNASHYARGSTLVMHVFIDHQWGEWDESERSEAGAKAVVAKEFFLEQAPASANLSFDNQTTGFYYYVSAYVDSAYFENGWDEANAAMTALGITDDDGDGYLADDYSLDLQFWNGGYDNVLLVFQVAGVPGRARASSIMSACFLHVDEGGNIWAHEWGHLFGGCDEYAEVDDNGDPHCHGTTDCDTCPRPMFLDEPYINGNCELSGCPSDVSCVMQHNSLVVCPYTRQQWSWEDDDGNGQLDWTRRIEGTNEYDIMEMWNGGSFVHNTTSSSFVAAVNDPSWVVFGLRSPATANYDLRLYLDNTLSYQPAWSGQAGSGVDFVVGDYSRSRTGLEHVQVDRASGNTANYNVVWQGNGSSVYVDGVSRNIPWGPNDVVQIRNLILYTGETVTFDLEPSGGIDAGMALFRSYGDFYFAGRHQSLWQKDTSGINATEVYTYDVTSSGTYGFVVWTNNAGAGNVAVTIGPGPITLTEETPVYSAAPLRLFNYTAYQGHWAGVATRPNSGTDVSLTLYDDANYIDELASSNEPGDELEMVAVHYASQTVDTDHLRVPKLSGTGGYRTEWEQSPDHSTGYITDTWSTSHVVKMWDVTLSAGETYVFRQYHSIFPPRLDSGLYLFDPADGDAQGKTEAAAVSDVQPASAGGEWFTYTADSSGDHGLAMVMNNEPDDSYSIWWGPRIGLGDDDAVRRGDEVIFGATATLSSDWVVWGARPNGGREVDIWFMDDPAYSSSTETSTGVEGVNFIVSDQNHMTELDTHYPRFRARGDEGVSDYEYEGGVEESLPFSQAVEELDLTWTSGDVVVAYDLFLDGVHGDAQDVVIEVEVLTGNMDLGLAIFRSDNVGGVSVQSIADAEALVDVNGAGAPESLTYSAGSSDVFGVVIFNQNAAGGTYRVRTFDPAIVSGTETSTTPSELAVRVDRNPLRQGTEVRFSLPEATPVDLRVFDVSGRLVRTLASGSYSAGHHTASWDGQGREGDRVGAGIYFIRLDAMGATRVTKVVQTIG